ncbi:MAG: hypothetical protein Q7U57_01840 [Methylovulum sp.]|nr:hypothetical protein [Methylovulum sp.]
MKPRQKSSVNSRYEYLAVFGLWLLSASVVQADADNPLTGEYYGSATITDPSNIATIDLALHLDVTGTSIRKATSYIDSDKTVMFPEVLPKVKGKRVGPRVSGSLNATKLVLNSQVFTDKEILGKEITRRIKMTSTSVSKDGTVIKGKYVETIDGFTTDRMVNKGNFQLKKLVPTVATQ